MVERINRAAVDCARAAADEFSTEGRPRFVAGSIGPTTKQMAISTSVDDASQRDIQFDDMVDSYYGQVAALAEAGVDILLPETVIDTLNLKSCLFRDFQVLCRFGSHDPGYGFRNLQRGGGHIRQQPEH